jgi:hypothetical protein
MHSKTGNILPYVEVCMVVTCKCLTRSSLTGEGSMHLDILASTGGASQIF